MKAVLMRTNLSAVCEVYQDFIAAMNLQRSSFKAARNLKSRFVAQMDRFDARCPSSQIPETLTALMLLANVNVDSSLRISVLAAAAPSRSGNDSITETRLNLISYDPFASSLRQRDQFIKFVTPVNVPKNFHASSTTTNVLSTADSRKREWKRLPPDPYRNLKR